MKTDQLNRHPLYIQSQYMTPSVHLPPQAFIKISHRPAIHSERYKQPLVFLSNPSTHQQTYVSTHTGVLDTASENEHYVGSAAGHTSSSHSLTELREGHLTTKPNTTAEKRKRFPKFKFSLTAPPPKPKPKQPGQSRPAVVSHPLLWAFDWSPIAYV